jgi:hypothetical protein
MIAPLRILQARAEARALLWQAGIFNAEEVLAPLYHYAIDNGISEEVADAIIRKAFELEVTP